MKESAIIKTHEVTRTYRVGSREIPALRGVSFAVGPGKVVARPRDKYGLKAKMSRGCRSEDG